MKHRPDIDGLRALAVIPVVLFHMDIAAWSGGFTGVDVFFVISGFLITSIIAHDIEDPARSFSLLRFYERRVRRIFPALFTVLAVTTLLAAVILLPRDLADYSKTLAATALFASNIHFYRNWGYFDSEAHTKPLLHTWSLAVEEQFYLIFPVLMILLYRYLRRRERVRLALGVIALSSFALATWQIFSADPSPGAAFYLAPSRTWELMLGALLALGAVPAFRRQASAEVAAVVGALMLLAGFVLISAQTPFPGPVALLPCVGAALLIHSGQGATARGNGASTRVGRLLSSRPLVFVGMISYSLYLWHWALLSMARHWTLEPLSMPYTIAVVAVSVLASWLSWKYIEQPLRVAGMVATPAPGLRHSAWRRVFAPAAAVSAFALAIGLTGAVTGGWPARIDERVIALDAAQQDYNAERPRCHANDRSPIEYANTCRFGAASATPSVAVWGDSHAAELAVALGEQSAAAGGSVRLVSYSGCPPAVTAALTHGGGAGLARSAFPSLGPRCAAHNRATLLAMRADTALTTVYLIARYTQAVDEIGESYFSDLGDAARSLADAGKTVTLVYPSPEYPYEVPVQLARAARRGEDLGTLGLDRAAFETRRAPLTDALDRIRADGRIGKVDPAGRLCDSERCHIFADGHPLYFDDDHLSLSGARFIAPLFRTDESVSQKK